MSRRPQQNQIRDLSPDWTTAKNGAGTGASRSIALRNSVPGAFTRKRPGAWGRIPAGNDHERASRTGFTLVELMVVISILGVILILAGMTFHLLLRTEKLVSQSFITERTLSRLAIQFRDDCHLSEQGEFVSSADGGRRELRLIQPGGTVVKYVIGDRSLVRILVERDEVVSREDYLLPECEVSIPSTSDGVGSRLRALSIRRPGAGLVRKEHSPVVLREMRIEAHLRPVAVQGTPRDAEQTSAGSTEATP